MADIRYLRKLVSGVPVVTAPSEIDLSTADQLRAVLLDTAARGHATVVVDLTGTRFCASAGLGVLVRVHNQALAEGGQLRLVVPASALVLRMFAVSGLDQLIPSFPSLYEAVKPAPAAARRPQQSRRRPKPGMRARADRQPPGPGATASTA